MFGFGNKFKGVDKKFIKNPDITEDYNSSEAIGRVRLGKLYFYYKDLGTKFYVPYDYIHRVYTREEMVQPARVRRTSLKGAISFTCATH